MINKKVYLHFPKSKTDKPIVYQLVKDFDLNVNILRAKITPEEEGYLSLELSGTQENIDRAFNFLAASEMPIHVGNKGMHWDNERCVHCGACLTHCPTRALSLADAVTRTVTFKEEHCIECLACVTVCPFAACSSVC